MNWEAHQQRKCIEQNGFITVRLSHTSFAPLFPVKCFAGLMPTVSYFADIFVFVSSTHSSPEIFILVRNCKKKYKGVNKWIPHTYKYIYLSAVSICHILHFITLHCGITQQRYAQWNNKGITYAGNYIFCTFIIQSHNFPVYKKRNYLSEKMYLNIHM